MFAFFAITTIFICKHSFEIFIYNLSKYLLFHFNACIYKDLNEALFVLVNFMDEINVDIPSHVPEEVLLLFLIAFDCI